MIRKMAPIGAAMLLATAAMPAQASEAERSTFGTLPDGRAVPAVTLNNGNGIAATVIAYGATLQSVIMPDRDGLELWSNQPGLQFYSGNFLDGTSHGKSNRIYREGDAIVMEPQNFPDTPNQPRIRVGAARPR